MVSNAPPSPVDPRVETARRVVTVLAVFVGLSVLTAIVFGAYNCATDRPARELFLEPKPPEAPR